MSKNIFIFSYFLIIVNSRLIPNHIIFDEDIVEDQDIFLKRLERLQDAARSPQNNLSSTLASTMEILFNEFIDIFQRRYTNNAEYQKRFQLFKASIRRHMILNGEEKIRNGTAEYGINKFADWSEDEYESMLTPQKSRRSFGELQSTSFINNSSPCVVYNNYADSADWRNKITAIKDQKNCGSCWAFVASEQIESYAAISGKPLITLSPQELISCSPSLGCEGGNTCAAVQWLIQTNHLLVPEKVYPYEEKDSKCRYKNILHIGVRVKNLCGCKRLAGHENIMLEALTQKGPLGINVDAVLWRDYTGGIIQHHCTNRNMNHAVQIVAYYLKDGPVPYYLARNQWGFSFGEKGFVRIKYGGNVCGVAEEPSFVVV